MLHPESVVQLLTGNVIVDRLLTRCQTVVDMLGVSLSEAEVLCASRDWDVEALVNDYVRDAAKAREGAGLKPVASARSALAHA